MRNELRVLANADAVAVAGATIVAEAVTDAVTAKGRCSIAVSGGRTPRAMFAKLAELAIPWERVTVFQVDERVAPDGAQDRNLTHLADGLRDLPLRIEAMPVGAADLDAAAARYAAALPERFDLVHLGIGADGHTASLVPGDAVLDVTDRLVAVTDPYQGYRRMTLTYPALARADEVLWLVAGEDKRDALCRLLEGDTTIPAARVHAPRGVILADALAT